MMKQSSASFPARRLWPVALLVSLLLTLALVAPINAAPPLPSSVYGRVQLSGADVPPGTTVTALIDGVVIAESATTQVNGQSVYTIDVLGDDPDTPTVEGGVAGSTIVFQVDGVEASQTLAWQAGTNTRLDLTAERAPAPPVATPQTLVTAEDTALPVLLAGSDANHDPLSFHVVDPPQYGVLSGDAPNLLYRPNANFHGADSFTFVANDGVLDSQPAIIAITVQSVNDAPVLAAIPDQVMLEGETLSLPVAASDADGDPLTLTAANLPAFATFSDHGDGTATLNFAPDYEAAEIYSDLTVTVSDGTVSASQSFAVAVIDVVQTAPVAYDQTVETGEDIAVSILLRATAINNEPLTYTVGAPANGVLSGDAPNLIYTPNPNFFGSDSFTFSASDGTFESNLAIITMTIHSVNDAPVVAAIPDQIVDEGAVVTLPVAASDVDGDALELSATALPLFTAFTDHGDGTGTLTFSPGYDDAGSYTDLTVIAWDGTQYTSLSFDLTVQDGTQPPVAAFTVDRERNATSYENGVAVVGFSSAYNTSTNAPYNAIDANTNSLWRTQRFAVSNQWMKVQLVQNETHVVDHVVVQGTNNDRSLKNFEVLVSATGSNDGDFVSVLIGALPQGGQPHSFSIAPVAARYVMLRALDNWGSTESIDVADFQLRTRPRDGGLVSMVEGLPAAIVAISGQYSAQTPATAAIDDSATSFWRSPAPAAGHWIRIGLGGSGRHIIDRVRIQSNGASEAVNSFEIRVWETTDTDSVAPQVFPFTGAANTEMQEFIFPPLAASVVELFVHSVHGGSMARVNSFQVLTPDGVNVARLSGVGAHVIEASSGASSAHQAIDAGDNTRWSAAGSTNQWITVRLVNGETHLIDRVSLLGGFVATASPRAFEVRVSTTGLAADDFTTVYTGVFSIHSKPNVYSFAPVAAKYVQLYILNNHGYVETQVGAFRVFAVDEGGATLPLVDHSSDAEGNVVGWHWDLGDGATSTEQHPTHTYAAPGVYPVRLTVTNSAGVTDSVTMSYTVLTSPVVDFTWDPAHEGTNNRFYDASTSVEGAVVGWQWRFPEANTIVRHPASVKFIDNGDWPVGLTATDSRWMQATITKTVSVANLPPSYEQSSNRVVPWGNIWRANAYVNDPGEIDAEMMVCVWDFGDGNIGRIDPCRTNEGELDYAHQQPGVYNVIYTATDKDGDSTSRTMKVTVTKRPTLVKSQIGAPDRGRNEVTVTAHLLDAMRPINPSHTLLADKPLIFDNGVISVTAVTTDDGSASVTFPIHDPLFNVTVRFAGDDLYEPHSNSYSVNLDNPLPKGDIVFIFDESLSMSGYQNAVKNRVSEIVDQLDSQIDYQLGLVGYGATALNSAATSPYTGNGWPHDNTARILLPLIHDANVFKATMDQLSSVGGYEAGFHATVVGTSDQMLFRPDAAACLILVTDENATFNILPGMLETQADALAALADRDAIFYGIFNPTFANATSDFGPLAALNGGDTFDLRTFVANASPMLAAIMDNCAEYARQTVIPDLAVEMETDAAIVRAGELLTYTMTISNVGTRYAPNVAISHTLPSEVTFVSASDGGSAADNVITWPIISMIAGDTITRTLTAQVKSPLPGGAAAMTATLSAFDATFAEQDQDPSNNVVSVATLLITNVPPIAANDEVTTDEDAAVTIDVIANDVDPDGDALTITALGMPVHGAAVGGPSSAVIYIPTMNFHGTDVFTYTISDGEFAATAAVTVTVASVNDAPVAANQIITTTEDRAVAITLSGADVEGDDLSFRVVTEPAHGTLSGEAPDLLYTPVTDFHGADSFAFVVNDGNVDSEAATVTLIVESVNDAPVAVDDSVTTAEDVAAEIDLLLNDSDADGDALSLIALGSPVHGVATINGPSSVIYTPTIDFHGADVFTYTVGDGEFTATAAVTVTILPVNDAPIAMDDEVETDLDIPLVIAVLENDYDVDSGTITVVEISQPVTGTATLHADGTVTYTPAAGFRGADNFTYTISDGEISATATVIVHVVLPPVITCELYPIALPADTLTGATPGSALPDLFSGSGPGNFGWLTWTGNPNTPTLANNLTPPGGSHTYVNPRNPADNLVSVGDWVQGSPGVKNAKPVRDALDALLGQEIVVPVWGDAQNQGNQAEYQVVDFARVRLTGYQLPGENRISAEWLGRAFCGETDLLRTDQSDAQTTETPIRSSHLLYLPILSGEVVQREVEEIPAFEGIQQVQVIYIPAVVR